MQNRAITGVDVLEMRNRMDLNQKEFGEVLGVSERTVRGWERGATEQDGMTEGVAIKGVYKFALQALDFMLFLQQQPKVPAGVKHRSELITAL